VAKPQRPFGLNAVAILLLGIGSLALAGLASSRFNSLYDWLDAVGAAVMVLTGILILVHQKYAVPCALLCATLLTLSRVHDGIGAVHGIGVSLPSISMAARALFNIALYWIAYEWFKRWRMRVDSSAKPQSQF
jgi:hypothetical protein